MLEDAQLCLTVQYENHTGRYMELSVRELTVNGIKLVMTANTLGESYWDRGYIEGTVGYVGDDNMYVTDLGPIIDKTGPIQTVDLTLSVGVYAEDYRKEMCPPITITF